MADSNILAKIDSILPFLSPSEKRIAKYIGTHPEEVTMLSIKELSQKCKTSEPTLIRFTRKIGLTGYTDLKMNLTANIAISSPELRNANISLTDNANTILNKLSGYTVSSIQSTCNTINEKDFEQAISWIYTAKKEQRTIFLTGMGASTILVKELQIKLMRININPVFYEDFHLRLEAAANLKKDDLLICFTALGHSKENNELIDLAKKKEVKSIIITQYGNNKYLNDSTICLFTSVTEDNLRLASLTSIAVQSVIIDAMFMALALKDYKEISEKVKEKRDLFRKLNHYTKI